MPKSDYLVDAAFAHWSHILTLYQSFEEKKPVMLVDIQEQRIYAYPYTEFRNDLNKKSQLLLEGQHDTAVRENMMVIFVRDNKRKKFVSFLTCIEE